MSIRKASSTLAAMLLAGSLSVLTPAGASAAPPEPGASPSSAGRAGTVVVLITGDRVMVAPDGSISVTPAPDRKTTQFSTYRDGGHQYVVPSDAMPLMLAGKVDQQLFDVTALIGYGYDATRGDLPLIVKTGTNAKSAARQSLSRSGAAIGKELSSIGAISVQARYAALPALWNQITSGSGVRAALRPEFSSIWLDRLYEPVLDESVKQIGADAAWQAGYDGTGVRVAVLDSGVDSTHPDFAGRIAAEANFTGEADASDGYGHGTHVASTVLGSGAASGGTYRGVAPGATLLNGKVCTRGGGCSESAMIQGIQWATDQGAGVVNLSISGMDTPGVDPLEETINTLTATRRVLFVAASGNTPSGAGDYSVGSPSTADAAVSVGAVDKSDNLAMFSNRGPRREDVTIKPDLTAPGVNITAARSSTGTLGTPGEQYLRISGTSMATPHVAGTAAILRQIHPDWTPAQLKAALVGSAMPNPTLSAFQQGAGRLNVGLAYRQSMLAEPSSVSLGRQRWPHEDDPVLNRTITYVNTGANGASVVLSVTAQGPDGQPAPAGMFTLSTTSLSLPPGASASVTLTATTSIAGPNGFYSGNVRAYGQMGGITVRTPFAVDRAPDGFDVTLNHIDRAGQPAQPLFYTTMLFPLTPGNPMYTWSNVAGPLTQFVLKGDYFAVSHIYDLVSGGLQTTVLTYPRLQVTADRSLTFDARTAGRVVVEVSDDSLDELYATEVTHQVLGAQGAISFGAFYQEYEAVYIGQYNQNVWEPGYTAKVVVTRAQPGPGSGINRYVNSPRSYHLGKVFTQNLSAGWTETFTTGALAGANLILNRHVADARVYQTAHARPGSGESIGGAQKAMPFDPPITHVEYCNAGSNIRWQSVFSEDEQESGALLMSSVGGLDAYPAGSMRTEVWNRAVFGPANAQVADPYDWVTRYGNTIGANVQMFGDSEGHPGISHVLNSGQISLTRNGVLVDRRAWSGTHGDEFTVSPGYAAYQLEVTAERGAPFELSTQVQAQWTFNSDTVAGDTPVRLPIWTLSFRPALDTTNTAPAGAALVMPVAVAAPPGSTAAGLRGVNVWYSTDDGATWTAAPMAGSGGVRYATVTHPNLTGFVSLRATVTDYAGNALTQTIVRAYKIAP